MAEKKIRLCDRILDALELALEQEDLPISELLTNALEQSITRNAGGGEFVERRDYSDDLVGAVERLKDLRSRMN